MLDLLRSSILVSILTMTAYDSDIARAASDNPFPQRVRAPDFPDNAQWINTPSAIRPAQLRGKLVLIDFWTLGCINCMHVIPELKKLERRWPNEIIVIGVHSGKFDSEKEDEAIAQAIKRLGIEHPVLNDASFEVWNSFEVRAWPTLILIDPQGDAIWGKSGEASFEDINEVIRQAVAYYKKKGELDIQPRPALAKSVERDASRLRYPGKVLADDKAQRLFIADSGNDRVLITDFDGKVSEVIGGAVSPSGRSAEMAVDGPYSSATFNNPQGMALSGDFLFVADAGNHLIRKIDLNNRTVSTVAGTGKQNRTPLSPEKRYPPLKTALNSPWALFVRGEEMYIAMAGPHQIWTMRIEGDAISVFAGNGAEDIVDGARLGARPYEPGASSFAQPSGLTGDDANLYVADPEGSSIRAVPFDQRGKVRTVLGTSKLAQARLFTFGDVDGPADVAKLQHPLDVSFKDGFIYVADAYNDKVKIVDAKTGSARTLFGKRGQEGDAESLDEPSGVSIAGDKLFIADTNRHAIKVYDLRKRTVASLTMRFPDDGEKTHEAAKK